ncbi:MAG: glycosyltransferase family 2 protein [Candidatus Cryptobacteroides sp.]
MAVKISIIVPVFKVEKYIRRCADSLFGQTFRDLEIIFVDDCSPDGSVRVIREVLESFPQRKEQVKIVRLEQNGGVDNARRQGCFASSGDYVMFVDSDDFLETQAVEKLMAKALETGADMTACRRRLVFADGRSELSPLRDDASDRDRYLRNMVSMNGNSASPNLTNKLFRADLLKRIEVLPAGTIAEDWLICVQAAHKADRIAFLDEPLYNYTIREDSATHGSTIDDYRRVAREDKANIDLVSAILSPRALQRTFGTKLIPASSLRRVRSRDSAMIPSFTRNGRIATRKSTAGFFSTPVFLGITARRSFSVGYV